MVDAAGTEGRDPVADIYAINKELEEYNMEIASRPTVIAANKIDAITDTENNPLMRSGRNLNRRAYGFSLFQPSAEKG